MFKSATFRLTMWYLAILMVVSLVFSLALYTTSTREFGRSLRRVPFPAYDFNQPLGTGSGFDDYRDQRIEAAESNLIIDLIGFNLIVLLLGGAASYWLAQRTLQPIEEAMEAQGRFTADASHELRTPLTSMRTEIEVSLRAKKLSEKEARSLLSSNLEEVKNLEALSAGLLTLARYSEHEAQTWEEVSLKNISAEAIAKIEPLANAHSIAINQAIDDVGIEGVSSSLQELLIVLLDNAIKYGKPNTATEVAIKRQGSNAMIEVSDKGVGIKAAEIGHIFDRFYRADSSRSKQKTGGYGLGLSIAKQIVDVHHGTINVTSKEGEGTTFLVKLPKKQPAQKLGGRF